jgi:transcriptional regulator with XRE-family HTH domain
MSSMETRTQVEQFWDWAENELGERSLTWHAVEKRAGLGNATISRRASHRLPPTQTTVMALADVFQIPRRFVFRQAGMLPPHIIGEPETDEIVHYYRSLTKRNRDILLSIAQALHEQQEKYNAKDRGVSDG